MGGWQPGDLVWAAVQGDSLAVVIGIDGGNARLAFLNDTTHGTVLAAALRGFDETESDAWLQTVKGRLAPSLSTRRGAVEDVIAFLRGRRGLWRSHNFRCCAMCRVGATADFWKAVALPPPSQALTAEERQDAPQKVDWAKAELRARKMWLEADSSVEKEAAVRPKRAKRERTSSDAGEPATKKTRKSTANEKTNKTAKSRTKEKKIKEVQEEQSTSSEADAPPPTMKDSPDLPPVLSSRSKMEDEDADEDTQKMEDEEEEEEEAGGNTEKQIDDEVAVELLERIKTPIPKAADVQFLEVETSPTIAVKPPPVEIDEDREDDEEGEEEDEEEEDAELQGETQPLEEPLLVSEDPQLHEALQGAEAASDDDFAATQVLG